MKYFLLTFLLLFSINGNAFTGEYFKVLFDIALKPTGEYQQGYIFGYIDGVTTTRSSEICAPKEVKRKQQADIIMDYVLNKASKSELKQQADDLIVQILQKNWKC